MIHKTSTMWVNVIANPGSFSPFCSLGTANLGHKDSLERIFVMVILWDSLFCGSSKHIDLPDVPPFLKPCCRNAAVGSAVRIFRGAYLLRFVGVSELTPCHCAGAHLIRFVMKKQEDFHINDLDMMVILFVFMHFKILWWFTGFYWWATMWLLLLHASEKGQRCAPVPFQQVKQTQSFMDISPKTDCFVHPR